MRAPSLLLFPAVLFLSACTDADTDTGLPEPQGDWIELPLEQGVFHESAVEYRSESYDIPLQAFEALEFEVAIAEGDTVVYSWEVDMAEPALLEVEFHGHTDRVPGDPPGLLMFYKIHNEGRESGTLTAPFDGIHGWYLNNQSEQDIVVRFHLSGFYRER